MNELKIEDELIKITRRIETVLVEQKAIQKQLDLLNGDRDILETIQARITALEEAQQLSRQNDNAVRKDIKEEINMAAIKTVTAVETSVEGLRSVVRSRKEGFRRPFWKFWQRG